MNNQVIAMMEFPAIGPNASDLERKELFDLLAADWKQKSRHMSNNAQMAMLKCYQRIIGMGWPAVQWILEELRRDPDQWFWALEAITGERPGGSDIAGNVRLTARAWIDWGTAKGFIKP